MSGIVKNEKLNKTSTVGHQRYHAKKNAENSAATAAASISKKK